MEKTQTLKAKKIVWNTRLDSHHTEVFAISIDGTDCRVWGKKDPRFPMDERQWSHKFNHGALKCKIGQSIFEPKCVWINGPFCGGKHDMTIHKEDGLKNKLKPHKRATVDRGHSDTKERNLSRCSGLDSKELDNFKARASLCHETFNGRLKNFAILRETFRHEKPKHKIAFEAVCAMIQWPSNL